MRHQFWAVGDAECPPELRAPNGELHTTRCKACGDGWRRTGNLCLSKAASDVLAERQRQIEREGYDPEHDDCHDNHEIAAAAAYYAMPPGAREWPATETGYGDTFGEAIAPSDWTMKDYGDRRRELVVAAALLLAEIERMDRGSRGWRVTP
jgi:hypothetical protein